VPLGVGKLRIAYRPSAQRTSVTSYCYIMSIYINFINIKALDNLEMWDTLDISLVLNGMMWAKLLKEVNRSKNYAISFHIDIIPIKCWCLLSRTTKHKNFSPNMVFNNFGKTLWTEKVTNNRCNNQPLLLVNNMMTSSNKQKMLGSWYHPSCQMSRLVAWKTLLPW
jgi:hypothetical protein